MASDDTQFCTDEELLQELKKLGYNDVSAEAFLMVKKDLFELMLQEKKVPINWQKYHELTSYKNLKYPDQFRNVIQPTAFLPGRSPTFVVDPDKKSPVNLASPITDVPQNKAENLKVKKRTPNQNLPVEESSKNFSLPTSSHISDSSPSECQKQSRNLSTLFKNSSQEKQPENYSLPSNSRVLNASPQKFNFISKKEKTQQQKPLIEEDGKKINLPPSSSVPNASPQKIGFQKTQRQKPLIEKDAENINLPPRSVPNASPQKFGFRKTQRQKPLVEANAGSTTNLPSSSSIPNASPSRNKCEDCMMKERMQKQNCSKKIEQKIRASYPSSHEPVLKECKNSNVPSQSSVSEEDQENADAASDASKSNDSSGTSISTDSFDECRDRPKTFKAGRESKSLGSPEKKDSSSVSLEGNKIKRKVLRHKNGKPVVTEEYLDTPNFFNTLSSNNSNTSVSSDSSGSLSAASPETSDTPRSTDSLFSSRSAMSRFMAGKKKSDPVAMYHYYKKFWNEHKPPGEKSHGKLRWAVRDKMLEYSL